MLRVRRHAVRHPRPVRLCSDQDQLLMELNGAVVVQGMRATDCGATYGVRRYGPRALVGCAAAVWLVMFGCHMAMAKTGRGSVGERVCRTCRFTVVAEP